MKGSSFTFDRADLLEYHLHKISLNRGGSYIMSSDWLKNKGATINPKNKDNECFKYAIIADYVIKKLEETHKECLSLNLLSMVTNGKT